MATEITTFKAQEGSTIIVRVRFYELHSDGFTEVPVIPNEGLKWSLFNEAGEIINLREDVDIDSANIVHIPLTGADLALTGDYSAKRRVVLFGTYDSVYGANLHIRVETIFQIENLVGT